MFCLALFTVIFGQPVSGWPETIRLAALQLNVPGAVKWSEEWQAIFAAAWVITAVPPGPSQLKSSGLKPLCPIASAMMK